MSEEKLDRILDAISELKTDVSELKTDVSELNTRLTSLEAQHATLVDAFRSNWKELSALYRAVRHDLQAFSDRVEDKLSAVKQSIQALRDSIERQDFRADELARRITRLELGEEPSI